jgi:(1->4)-alpha-D-glucan 1-alpha-D-glucosylmutase
MNAVVATPGPERSQRRDGPLGAIIPRATYRVQLHAGFRFSDATALVPYLAELGISHLYCSPFLRARAGSKHGYDVVDHAALNPEIGTRAELDTLVDTLHAHDMGLLIDLVPNHMGVLGGDNAWWLDVLENGHASAFAEHFDIDWQAADPALTGRVLLPLLGDQYGVVLERGELRLQFADDTGRFTLNYYEHRLPIDPSSYGRLLRQVVGSLRSGEFTPAAAEALDGLIQAFEQLPARDTTDPQALLRRQRDKTQLKQALARQVQREPVLSQAIARWVVRLNGSVGQRTTFDALDALIAQQPYRLAHWLVASDQINYRRFFDINELAALRMERAEVFEATHALVMSLAASGAVDGVRIDHPDGLADPAAYFRRLQLRYARDTGLDLADVAGQPLAARPLYVALEKIVAPHEQVPADWAVHGTTGYRFANVVNGLLIDGSARARLDRGWRAFVGDEAEDFDELSWRCRHDVMDGALAGELTVLATALQRLAREDRRTRDFTLNTLRRVLADLVASFPVYRTYIIDKPSPQDRRFIDWAIGRARRRSLAADGSLFDFLRRVLLGKPLPGAPAGLATRYNAFARRLQQYTSPVVAKGIEDTALYRHHRLISVNDVGGEPDDFGTSVQAFHAASRDRAERWPHTMLATSTHDAKRSEDVRARINVISEMPAAWRLTVRRWSRLNRRHKRTVGGQTAPSRNDEYLLYQTLVGSMPSGELDDAALALYTRRIEQAMLKSARESKVVTSWINPNPAYEEALTGFVAAVLERRDSNLFLVDLLTAVPLFAWYGSLNSTTMAALKCLSPGVPDFYQGHAAIELTLMDPDNRGQVDHARRRVLLARAQASMHVHDVAARGADLRSLLEHVDDGEAKFRVTWAALQLRRTHEAMMRHADHVPLAAHGERAAHVVAFGRRLGAQWIVVVATRLYASFGLPVGQAPLGDTWGDTVIEWPALEGAHTPLTLIDSLTGRSHALRPCGAALGLPLAELLQDFPVALLHGVAADVGARVGAKVGDDSPDGSD